MNSSRSATPSIKSSRTPDSWMMFSRIKPTPSIFGFSASMASVNARLRDAAPVTGDTSPAVPPKPDQQQLADELGAEGDPLDQRIADAEDFIPEEEGGGSDAVHKELADRLPRTNLLEKCLEDAEDAKTG